MKLQRKPTKSERKVGLEILAGIKEIKAHKKEKIVLVTRILRQPPQTKKCRTN